MESDEKAVFSEGEVARRLEVDRLEIYLLAAAENVGQFDNSTHLLMFTSSEMELLAKRLRREQLRQQVAPPDGERPRASRSGGPAREDS